MLETIFKKLGYSKVLNEEKRTDKFESKNKISRTLGTDEEFTYASASMVLGIQGIPQPKKLQTYEQYVHLFGECVWVYACVYQIATSIAGVPFLLYKKATSKNSKPELIEDINDPAMLLLANPNPWMGQYELKEAIMANLELTGNCYLEEVRKGAKLLELYPLQSHKVKIVPGKNASILGYVYEALGTGVPFNEDEITHIKYFNPKSDFYGASPLTAAEISTKADVYSGKWNKNFFENSARPDAVLETDSSLNPTLLDRLKSQWRLIHRGVSKSHDIAILEGGIKYRQISMNMKDMDFVQLRKYSREEILAAYGVHGAIVGIIEDANNSIMGEIRRNFWENSLLPKMTKVENALNRNLIEQYFPGYKIVFDLDSIEALKESRETRARVASMLVDRGILTQNEARKKYFNLESKPWGDTWYMPLNLLPVERAGEGLNPFAPIGRPAIGTEQPKHIYPTVIDVITGELRMLDYQDYFTKAFSELKGMYPIIDSKDEVQRAVRKKAFEEVHSKLEEEFLKILTKLFKKQAKSVIEAFKNGKSIEELEKIVDSDKMKFRVMAEEFYSRVIQISGTQAMKEIETQVKENA